MSTVYIGLMSTDGDRIGHLVRGVQMLRSYGKEADVERYSDVIQAGEVTTGEQPALCCLIECESDTSPENMRGILREVEWALGDDPSVLTARLVRFGQQTLEDVPRPMLTLLEGEGGYEVFQPAGEFEQICDWGQQHPDGNADIIGEWPSATGR